MVHSFPARFAVGIFLLAVFQGGAATGDDAAPLTDADRDDLAFFMSLGFPDVAGKPYVEVETGRGWVEEGVTKIDTVNGFLLRTGDDGSFTVLTDELLEERFVPSAVDVQATRRVRYARRDPGEKARQIVDAERDAKDKENALRQMELRFGERLGLRGRLLAFAWACHRNGLDVEAHGLLEVARRAGAFWNRETDTGVLRKDLYEEFATAMVWSAVLDFGDGEILRPALLATFKRYLRVFGGSVHAKTAREAVDLLTKMVAEDEAHANETRDFEAMSPDQQVAELIFRLRDQNGGQFVQPGSPSVFFSLQDPDDEDTAAHRLVRMGFTAVPLLIESLTDVRFTRTVGYWRNFTYSHYVVRVGDAALAVLERIARRSFWSGNYTAASMAKDGEQAATQERARAWWKDLQVKGELQTLIDDVTRADGNSASAAQILVEKYPEAALEAIRRGLENAGPTGRRLWLIQVLTHLPGETQAPTLLHELREGTQLDAKLSAAWWLVSRGHPEAVDAMIADVKAVRALPPWESMTAAHYADFFEYAGTEAAVRHLIQTLEEMPPALRRQVLGVMNLGRGDAHPPLSARGLVLLEDYVVGLTEDETPTGEVMSGGGRTVSDGRVADLAARKLAELWGDPDAFDRMGTLPERERQLHALRNRWREKRGLPALPDPQEKSVAPLRADEAAALIAAWRKAAAPVARERAENAIEAAGLAILPALCSAAEESASEGLATLARRVAFVVREIRTPEREARLPENVAARVRALPGRPLALGDWEGVLAAIAADFPEDALVVRVTADRFGRSDGVRLTVASEGVPPDRKVRSRSWQVRTVVQRGQRVLGACRGNAPEPRDSGVLMFRRLEPIPRVLTRRRPGPSAA